MSENPKTTLAVTGTGLCAAATLGVGSVGCGTIALGALGGDTLLNAEQDLGHGITEACTLGAFGKDEALDAAYALLSVAPGAGLGRIAEGTVGARMAQSPAGRKAIASALGIPQLLLSGARAYATGGHPG